MNDLTLISLPIFNYFLNKTGNSKQVKLWTTHSIGTPFCNRIRTYIFATYVANLSEFLMKLCPKIL